MKKKREDKRKIQISKALWRHAIHRTLVRCTAYLDGIENLVFAHKMGGVFGKQRVNTLDIILVA